MQRAKEEVDIIRETYWSWMIEQFFSKEEIKNLEQKLNHNQSEDQ